MKLLAVFMLAACLQVHATSFGQKVSLSVKNVPISSVFQKIRKQTGYIFFYRADQLKNTKSVSFSIENSALPIVLDLLFKNQPLTYKIIDKTIVIKDLTPKPDQPTSQQEASVKTEKLIIKGQVTDSLGRPLESVNVVNNHKGRFQSYTLTDKQGAFEITAEKGDKLTFSFVGFQDKTITIQDEHRLNITLNHKQNELGLVTVNTVSTGYQTISKERSAGAFAKPDIAKFEQANSAGGNIIQRLDGLVAGLTINNSPDITNHNGGSAVLLRGLTSINENREPLYVVDGLPTDNINSLNYNDVEDITVLKDATAASIWGARAANGVIVITTKKAKGSKLQVDYDVNYNLSNRPDFKYLHLMDSHQFIDAVKQVYNNDYFTENTPPYIRPGIVAPHEQVLWDAFNGKTSNSQVSSFLDSLSSIDNLSQIQSLWYRKPLNANHTISVAGNSGFYGFRASFSFADNKDNVPGDNNKSYNLLLRNDFNFGRKVKAYVIGQLNDHEITSSRFAQVRPHLVVFPATGMNVLPYQLWQDNGKPVDMSWINLGDSLANHYQTVSGISTSYYPLKEAVSGSTKTSTIYAKATGGIAIDLIDGLRFEGTYGIEKKSGKTTGLDDANSWLVRREQLMFYSTSTNQSYIPNGEFFQAGNTDSKQWTVRNQLIYDKDWQDKKHQLTILLGQEAQDNLISTSDNTQWGYNSQLLTYQPIDYYTLSTVGVANPLWFNNGNNATLYPAQNFTPTETEYRFTSYYTNLGYTFNRKYTLNGSWRNDQSNLFGKAKSAQKKPVWSAGVSWMLSRENFMQSASTWLDQLQIRASYGITGNAPTPGTAASFDIAGPTQSPLFPNGALEITTPANKTLSWEETKTTNIGMDISVLKGRLTATFNIYKKNTTHLIGILPLNIFTGYASITGNYGAMSNKGIEISLNSINVKTNDFTWRSAINLAYNKNKITKLTTNAPLTSGSQLVSSFTSFQVGYASPAIFAYPFAGLDEKGNPQIQLKDGTVTSARTAVVKPEDMKYMGPTQPAWNGGLLNTFSYRSFSLSANIIFNSGFVMRRDVNQVYTGPLSQNLPQAFANRWQKPGDEKITNIPAYLFAAASSTRNTAYYTQGDINVLDASFMKLRDLSLSYNLPKQLSKKIMAQDIALRVGISNVMLWRANDYGIDPEFQLNSFVNATSGFIGGYRTLPVNQNMLTLGAHITF